MFYNENYEVLTPAGFKPFKGIQQVLKSGRVTVFLKSGKELICAPNHKILTSNGWVSAIDLINSDIVITNNKSSEIFFIDYEEGEFEYYDLLGVDGTQYYTNDIISHNCEFLGSANTLIHPAKLRALAYRQPITQNELGLKYYDIPEKGMIYAMVVDTSRGIGGDFSAFIVVNVSVVPYKMVATFRNNLISPLIYPNIIYETAKHYNDALVLIETNDIGQQVADIMHYDLEYEGVFVTANNGRTGQSLSGGFATTTHYGVRTTKQVKRIGCSSLKTLVEADKFIIEDYDTINELTRFSLKGQSYEAEDGHDDLAMCCVLFGWLTSQPYLKELTDVDIRKKIYEQNERMFEEEMLPFGIYSSGDDELDREVNDPITTSINQHSGDFWSLAKDNSDNL